MDRAGAANSRRTKTPKCSVPLMIVLTVSQYILFGLNRNSGTSLKVERNLRDLRHASPASSMYVAVRMEDVS